MKHWKSVCVASGLLSVGLVLAACGSDDDDASSGDNAIEVSLSEWMIEAPTTAEAGSVNITAVNEGGETHELVIVRAGSSEDFVIDETGKVDEAGFAEGDFIGEIEEFEAETSESATFELDAGTYVLFCNIVEEEADGTYESHFLEGMETTITVN